MKKRGATNWTIGIVVVLIVLIVAFSAHAAWRQGDRFTLDRTREVRSGVDGLPYRVHLVHGDPRAAADTMAELNRRAVELMRHLRGKYLRGPGRGAFPAREEATRRLLGLYNPDNLAENSPRDPEGDTSYTIDKGAILALCLREKGPGGPDAHGLHDLETLAFVTLHELTHIAVKVQDHPQAYWNAFKFVLQEAVEAGLLRGVDYARHPTVYCGMDIDYNPLFDASLPPLA
jgi:hypothetical protein